jgi:hypothetical protein
MPTKLQSARPPATSQQRGINVLAHALEPVAKLCMKSGMGAGELLIAAKIACIGVAAETAKLGNRLNHSRIAAATGLTRKEVRTLFGLVKTGVVPPGREVAKQRTTRVLHGWRTDPEFLDRQGSPNQLVIRGPGLTFHTLWRSYGGEVTPSGNKNEALPLLAAALLASGNVGIENVPRIRDVSTLIELVRGLGVTVDWSADHTVTVDAAGLRESRPDAISARLKQEAGSQGQQRLIEYGIGAQILLDLGVSEMTLLSNSPARKIVGLEGYGLKVAGHRGLE